MTITELSDERETIANELDSIQRCDYEVYVEVAEYLSEIDSELESRLSEVV